MLATYGANLHCGDEELAAVEQGLAQAQVLVLQMEIPFPVSLRAAQCARERGVRVLLDPAPATEVALEDFAHFDIVAPNQTEAEYYTGLAVVDENSARRAAAVLLEWGVGIAIIKMGELGVYFESDQTRGFVPPFAVEAVDTTSAGDAFHGALAVALAEGRDLAAAVRFGAAAGALAVTPGPGCRMRCRPGRRWILYWRRIELCTRCSIGERRSDSGWPCRVLLLLRYFGPCFCIHLTLNQKEFRLWVRYPQYRFQSSSRTVFSLSKTCSPGKKSPPLPPEPI